MLTKVSGLARALGIVLALVAGFMPLGFDVMMVLLVLGLISGLSNSMERLQYLGIMVIALPLVGTALTHLPMLGTQLSAVAGGLAMQMSGGIASGLAIGLFNVAKGDLMALKG